MAAFLDLCRFIPTAGGTTDWTFSSAAGGCQGPAAANAVNGTVYKFLAVSTDLTQWEITEGAYNSTGAGSFARTTVLYNSSGTGTKTPGQSGAGTKINFSAAPQVAIIGVKEDLLAVEEANSFTTTQQGQARKNIAAAGVIKTQVLTSSGAYTPSANLLYCIVECVGAGGGGGGVVGSSNANSLNGGGGGGGGGYARKIMSAATIGVSQTVTIGTGGSGGSSSGGNATNGGDTSVGALCIGKGGTGGGGGNGVSVLGRGGAGGVAGTGDFTVAGMAGGDGLYIANLPTGTLVGATSQGGNAALGFGAGGPQLSPASATVLAGNNGSSYGGGGSGAVYQGTTSGAAGGTGANGAVIITEFCAA